jgi:acetyltransferase-like isoleucine patch superfamily enzyme
MATGRASLLSSAAPVNDRQRQLLDDLRAVHAHLRDASRATYGRINPFTEDLIDWHERGRYWTGDDRGVTIYNSTSLAGDVRIGRGTWIGPFCSLDGTGGLEIGEGCDISAGVQLVSHDSVRRALSGGAAKVEAAPIRIGDRCFVGSLAVVTRGVTIGRCCLIAAGSVVTSDVPDQTIVAGVPARRIGRVELDGDDVRLVYDA